jgi:hypothetical protein
MGHVYVTVHHPMTDGPSFYFVEYHYGQMVIQRKFKNPFNALTFGAQLASFHNTQFTVVQDLMYAYEEDL